MKIFKSFSDDISYKDDLQLDGAFSVAHINYGKSPIFNEFNGKIIAEKSKKHNISSTDNIKNVIEYLHSFKGTEKDFTYDDKIQLWEEYWVEYINAFDKLIVALPKSIVTIYIGRQAIELGIKYLLSKKGNQIPKTHKLGELMQALFSECKINDDYMNCVVTFCKDYCEYIEDSYVEYFRFPEYKSNCFFAGNKLDIEWLSYNFSLILLKLVHYANLEHRFSIFPQ